VSSKAPHVAQSELPLDVFRISAMLIHFAARFDAEGQAEFFEALSSSSICCAMSRERLLTKEKLS